MAAANNVEQGKAFVKVLAAVLTRLVANNDQSGAAAAAEVTRFHALRPPNISIGDYLERIHKYASCSAECFILALVYIDRLIQGNNLTLTSLNVHRVIITSVMLGAKFFDDQYFNNAYYAKVGGVPCPEMNSLELEFLFSINFSLQVSGEVYNRYRGELATHLTAMMPGPDAAELHAVMIHAPAAAEPVPLDGESSASSSSSAAAAGASSAVVAPGQAPWAGEDEDEDVDSGAVTAFATM
ncbi:hypothetical protein FNF27_07407 [Cafeteria roenbergensis]|uniref:Cyclin n=2 Tax=Cafeteria roenbergensis TaxID=33653 RepID=A0A5A8DGC0_CAFRO|nr:hypothetical protein FNF29_07799 [Cafeteria roenbergensis]KAA0150124.1 hypothetical protein FNF31_07075 [Cafeteria roenbergensis]KAA0164348.1 hypothetical protein FNF28_03888 [Cafeteria roenbergensis]KAA0167079.1 hypothetical protein FNF27_07407 [Cafeteria roenbergensis]|eukprot:KAA0146823.1 hypothetical protein FNF29_07799 [Cafeteria roenbergensis]